MFRCTQSLEIIRCANEERSVNDRNVSDAVGGAVFYVSFNTFDNSKLSKQRVRESQLPQGHHVFDVKIARNFSLYQVIITV